MLPQYLYLKSGQYVLNQPCEAQEICKQSGLEGFEVYADDLVDRNLNFYSTTAEKQRLTNQLIQLGAKRLHCSYWAYPTAYITKNNFTQLVNRLGGQEQIAAYYGDLSATHMFERWAQEYEIAKLINAQAYTFHLIDYAPIDGAWEFTLNRDEILQAMIFMVQQFLCILMEKNLITETSPQIELENAGWGLEYGAQTAEDFVKVFEQLYDPLNKVFIAWDINHLLHALGDKDGKTVYMLTKEEISKEMPMMSDHANQHKLVENWVSYNVLHSGLQNKVGSIHLSDCRLKNFEYFSNGKLNEPYFSKLNALETWQEKEEYGVDFVLSHYDSHLPLGEGCLSGEFIKNLIYKISQSNKNFVITHELKNSKHLAVDLGKQLDALK